MSLTENSDQVFLPGGCNRTQNLRFGPYTIKIAFCVQCYSVLYFHTAYYSVYGVNSYTSLNRNDYVYLKVTDLVFVWHNGNKSHG